MGIRKPSVSVNEARRLAGLHSDQPALPAAAPAGVLVPAPPPSTASAPAEIRKPVTPPLPASAPVMVRKSAPAAPPVPDLDAVDPEAPRIQVFLSAPLPATGASASFDMLSRQYPPAKALQMVLRRALDDYEVLLGAGDLTGQPLDYPIEQRPDRAAVVPTSRMMPLQLVERARIAFDPLGFESARAFGLKLASAALAAFFARESR